MTTNDQTYNGWTNYPTWNVALWTVDYYQEIAQEFYDDAEEVEYASKSTVARMNLADQMETEFVERYAEEESGPMADIFSWAVSNVNWTELADHALDDVEGYGAEGY